MPDEEQLKKRRTREKDLIEIFAKNDVDLDYANRWNGINIAAKTFKIYTGGTQPGDGDPATGADNAVERFRIDNDGNVGIGTNDPDVDLHLYKANSADGCMITIESDGGDGSSIPSSGILFKTNDGSPNNPTSSDVTYDSGRILSSWTSGSGAYNQSYIKFQTHADNDATFTDDMIIKGGNVGIGTTSPGGRLEIVKDAVANNNAVTINGNVMNDGYIDNLPSNCCVEVPCLINSKGNQPQKTGRLPEHLAALMRTNINVQILTAEAALTNKKEHIYHAAMLDPLTGANLSIDEIYAMVDKLIEAHGNYLPKYH